MEHSILIGRSLSDSSFLASVIYAKEEAERLKELEVMVDLKETVFSRNNRIEAHVNLQRLSALNQTFKVSRQESHPEKEAMCNYLLGKRKSAFRNEVS